MNFLQVIKRIDYKKILLVVLAGFILHGVSSFEIISLQIQSERLNKKICIQEMIPTNNGPIPLEVIK